MNRKSESYQNVVRWVSSDLTLEQVWDIAALLVHASVTDGAHHKQHDILQALMILIPDRDKWRAFYEENEPDTGIPA